MAAYGNHLAEKWEQLFDPRARTDRPRAMPVPKKQALGHLTIELKSTLKLQTPRAQDRH